VFVKIKYLKEDKKKRQTTLGLNKRGQTTEEKLKLIKKEAKK
jgi:hypothetical protein